MKIITFMIASLLYSFSFVEMFTCDTGFPSNYAPKAGKVVVLPVGALGLGNRLRIISSVFQIATSMQRRLIVLWTPNLDCQSRFDELFTVHDLLIPFLEIIDVSSDDDDHFNNIVRGCIKNATNFHSTSSIGVHLRDYFVSNDILAGFQEDVLLLWTRGSHSLYESSCNEAMFTKSMLYTHLIPTLPITNIINAYKPTFIKGSTSVVGVHIRAHDINYDWEVVPPLGHDITAALRFDQISPLEGFVRAMQQILSRFPNTKFFVASNSASVKRHLLELFGSISVISIVDDVSGTRSFSAAIQLAVAEFLLLADTQFVLHTRGSSFAREAASVHMRPVVDVTVVPQFVERSNGGLDDIKFVNIVSQDMSLPQCGIQERFRAVVGTIIDDNDKASLSSNSKTIAETETGLDGYTAASSDGTLSWRHDGLAAGSEPRATFDSDSAPSSDENLNSLTHGATGSRESHEGVATAKVCYSEDTQSLSPRTMCTRSILYCPCQPSYSRALAGLLDLYCVHAASTISTTGNYTNFDKMIPGPLSTSCISILAESNGYTI